MKRILLSLVVAALVAVPAVAQPITVAPGNDTWITPPNSSQIVLSIYPVSAALAAAFGPGASVSPNTVFLSGVPLNPGGLGQADTILERYPPSVTFNAIGDVRTQSVEIQGLRLRGNVTVTTGSGVTMPYTLTVALSEIPSGSGTITMTRTTADGGRFDSDFPVQPKLVFDGPGGRVVIDCGLVPGCPANNRLRSFNNCWEVKAGPNNFNPAAFGIPIIPVGVPVDGTFDGANDYVTVGRLNGPGLEFHVGRQPAPPWAPCGDSVHDHAVFSLTHKSRTPDDCKQPNPGTISGNTVPGDDTGGTIGDPGNIDVSRRICLSTGIDIPPGGIN